MINRIRSLVGPAVLGLAAVVSAPLASAAIVTGSWDPPMVSPPFSNLGWTTTINFSVPDDCLGASGIINVRFLGRSFGCASETPAITVLRAQFGIYDLTSEILKYVVTLDANSLRPNLLDISSGGEITYLFSLLPSAPEQLTILGSDLESGLDQDFFFRLALPGAAPQLQYSDTGNFFDFDPASIAPPVVTGFRLNNDDEQQAVLTLTELRVGNSINQVPEPRSLALVLLALGAAGAAGAAARRGRQRAPHCV